MTTTNSNQSGADAALERFDLGRVILTDGTYDVIKSMILDHRIPAGARVSIDGLARQLNVSQTPVREALARLEADALVVKVPLKGYETTKLLTIEEFRDLFRFRAVLEPWAAAEATVTGSDEEMKALMAEIERGQKLAEASATHDDFPGFVEHDMRFHMSVAAMSHNLYVEEALIRARVHLHLLRAYLASQNASSAVVGGLFLEAYSGGRQAVSVTEHRAIATAIENRDASLARDLMFRHIESSRERLASAIAVLHDPK